MKKASLSEWEAIGAQSKRVQEELSKLFNLTTGKMPIPIVAQLTKSMKQLAEFKCKAEDRMLKTGVSDSLNIFYGKE